ncbi:MAG TPA: hypothetical protein VGH38_09235, partial [Bryobacteraceae bacterium]
AFKAFDGALGSKAAVNQRIMELRESRLSAISVNSYLGVLNAFFKWSNQQIKIPRLKKEQKILATFTPDHIRRLVQWKPVGRNETWVYAMALTALDCGLLARLTRANEKGMGGAFVVRIDLPPTGFVNRVSREAASRTASEQ